MFSYKCVLWYEKDFDIIVNGKKITQEDLKELNSKKTQLFGILVKIG